MDELIINSLERIATATESIAVSLEKIANPPIITLEETGPHDARICTCTMDPRSRNQCVIHGKGHGMKKV